MMRCDQCRFYYASNSGPSECRRSPPRHSFHWPEVRSDNWCGEFQTKEAITPSEPLPLGWNYQCINCGQKWTSGGSICPRCGGDEYRKPEGSSTSCTDEASMRAICKKDAEEAELLRPKTRVAGLEEIVAMTRLDEREACASIAEETVFDVPEGWNGIKVRTVKRAIAAVIRNRK